MPDSLAVRAAKTVSIESAERSSALTRVGQVLDGLAARDHGGEVLTAVRHYPAR